MTKIYFAGQDNFGNRGCEALIRSSVDLINSEFGPSEFAVPSARPTLDAAQWPDAERHGVRFVQNEPFPAAVRWWGRFRRMPLAPFWQPTYRATQPTREAVNASDALLMTGGDIISLDYGPESLFYWAGVCRAAKELGKPAILWGASVGPFARDRRIERAMREFLAEFELITVREDASLNYLATLGIPNVYRVSDPAFCLQPDAHRVEDEICFRRPNVPLLGFNISPVIRGFRPSEQARTELDEEVVRFLVQVANDRHMDVLLVPHVDPLDGSGGYNSDSEYMTRLLDAVGPRLSGNAGNVAILRPGYNAAQLKHVISKCDFFMGGRTHATIAAMSMAVPTTSIAYSVKARGINLDVFGHDEFVLPTPDVTSQTLSRHLDRLIQGGAEIRTLLSGRKAGLQASARRSATLLKEVIDRTKKPALRVSA